MNNPRTGQPDPKRSSEMDLRERLQESLGATHVLERELGGGGMSRVFVATDTALGRRVVVKVLPEEMAGQLSVERFKREISIAARLQHPHIVPLLTAGEVGALPYFTMPYVEGESLREWLTRGGELPLADVVRTLREIASALAYAHSRDVVHRDIKPENVLMSGGAAMVTDFGVSKALSAASASGGEGTTSAGMALGTPAYMAPEQATADPHVDQRADLYAWGMMAYELITGQSAFAGRSAQAMLAAQVIESPEPIERRRSGIAQPLAAIIMRCLEKRPADRPQSADELVRTLDGLSVSGGDAPRQLRISSGATGPTRGTWAIGVAATALVLALGTWYALRQRAMSPGANDMTLAVLPIENLGGDSTTQYLADGMTGELSSALTKMPKLQVIGDLSTFRFKGTHTPPAEIARQLGVRMMLTGRIQPAPGRLRLQMQLSDAAGKLIWSQTYDRQSKDNFATQDEITGAIASELRVALSPVTVAVTRAGRTVSPEAHDLFMRGQFEKNKVSAQGLKLAVQYFHDALKIDPDYAQAYAGLAFAYDIQADVYAPSHEYHMLAMNAARQAVAADSLLAEARVIYGFELAAANWDFVAGRKEMDRGLALNPRSPDAIFMVATFSFLSGDTQRAIELAEQLVRIDPLSPLAAHLRAETLLWAGRYKEALERHREADKLDPNVTLIDATDGNALRELGRLDESLAAFIDFQKKFDLPSFGIAMTYGRLGRREDGLRVIRALEERAKKQWVDPDFIAMAYAGIGDRDHAMEWFEKAFRMKTYGLRLFLNWNLPWLPNMQDDPRFIALRQRVLATTFKS